MKEYQVQISGEIYQGIRDDIEVVANRAGIEVEFDGSEIAMAHCNSKEEALELAHRINKNIIEIDHNLRLLVASALENIVDEDGEIEETNTL